jgi:hypothetical protein
MSSSSVSFRISRHTQDLAETVHTLSQRLVTLEQRLLALEDQLQNLQEQPRLSEDSEAATLAPVEAHIARLLQDCRQLLAEQPDGPRAAGRPDPSDAPWTLRSEDGAEQGAAAGSGAVPARHGLLPEDAGQELFDARDAA